MSYSDDEFDDDILEDIVNGIEKVDIVTDGDLIEPSVLSAEETQHIDSEDNDECASSGNFTKSMNLELHGKGSRMKLSKKPPEVLLRRYKEAISNSLRQHNVSLL